MPCKKLRADHPVRPEAFSKVSNSQEVTMKRKFW